MRTSEAPQSSSGLLSGPYRQQLKKQKVEDQYYTIASNVPKNFSDDNINRTLFRAHAGQLFTLDSSPMVDCGVYGSPTTTTTPNTTPTTTASFSSNWSALSSDNNTSGSPLSGSSGVVDGGNELTHMLRELENRLMGPASEMYNDTSSYSFTYLPDSEQSLSDAVSETSSFLTRWKRMREIAPSLDTKDLLNVCAEAVADADVATAEFFMGLLEKRVSVSGDPFQRLSAYLLEGLRARLLSSGSTIYKKLNCDEPTGPELMSYMQVLYHLCPYYKFAYVTSNAIIGEAVAHEDRVHVIDFQIAQGSQWMLFIKALSQRPGGPPFFRLTGVDDHNSARARGGGLALVGERVAKFAASCGVPFEFHAAAISGSEVEPESLRVGPGEAVAVNFPYFLHHMPDEGVSTANHRDRLLRLVKGLSPRVVALVEQEANTNTAPFLPRFRETVDYYSAMFESIDGGAHPRDDRRRIGTEEHCVARDVVNLVACEGGDRVERHEVFGKWRMRMTMAGFAPCPLSPSVGDTMAQVLREYSPNYWMRESPEGALFLGWKARALSTCSAWR